MIPQTWTETEYHLDVGSYRNLLTAGVYELTAVPTEENILNYLNGKTYTEFPQTSTCIDDWQHKHNYVIKS